MQYMQIGSVIFGARGYSGLELARLLLKHPQAKLVACFATDAKWKLSDYLPESAAAQVPVLAQSQISEINAMGAKLAFLATPAEVSAELAPKLLAQGLDVIDLSGAYRLSAEDGEKWYGLKVGAELARAQYGLVPWQKHGITPGTQLISNPGCYATAVLMGLLPLLKSGAVKNDSIVIDAKSGTSGGGRKAAENLLFTEVDGECLPYRVGRHQHLPEIARYAQIFAGATIDPHFTTSLIPVRRGIIAGIYAKLAPSFVGKTDAETLAKIQGIYNECYSSYPLVRVEQERDALLSLKRVAGSARTHVAFYAKGDKLFVFSSIDNLLKGAASQAVENFNRLQDLPLNSGLSEVEGTL